ncbi:hypothetical protein YC2023_084102 [Brassica napus]
MDENHKVEAVRGQTKTRSERGETDSENWAVVCDRSLNRNTQPVQTGYDLRGRNRWIEMRKGLRCSRSDQRLI